MRTGTARESATGSRRVCVIDGRSRTMEAPLALVALTLMLAAALPVQPLGAGEGGVGNYYVTCLSGEDVLLAPSGWGLDPSAAKGGVAYSLEPLTAPSWLWTEGFDSPPQGSPAAQWAAANGWSCEGMAPELETLYFNVTGSSLLFYSKGGGTRPAATYNFTMWKELDEPLFSLDLIATVNYLRTANTYNSGAGQPKIRITAYDPDMTPIATVSINRTSANYVSLYASAYGGGWTACGSFYYATTITVAVSMNGYGNQASIIVGGTACLNFTTYLPVKYVGVSLFLVDTGIADSTNYWIYTYDVSVAPRASDRSLIFENLPAGEWRYAPYRGSPSSWSLQSAGAVEAASVLPVFNGEFTDATTGSWAPLRLGMFSASSGLLSTRSSGGTSGLGTTSLLKHFDDQSLYLSGAYYWLPGNHPGDFSVEAKVAEISISRLPANVYVGLVVFDPAGRMIAYVYAQSLLSSTSNTTTVYMAAQCDSARTYTATSPWFKTALSLKISRTGTSWALSCQEYSGTHFYPTGAAPLDVGGILLYSGSGSGGTATFYWDYTRTDLPADRAYGAVCGDVPLQASASGTLRANTTAAFTAIPSGAALVTLSERADAGGLKVTGVGEGDVVTVYRQDGTAAYNATVPAGASELAVTGISLPLAGTVVVTSRPFARPIAQYSGSLSNGDTLTLASGSQGYTLSKTGTGGGFSGAVVAGLQPGWKVTITDGTKAYTYYANGTGGAALTTLPPGMTKTVSVHTPTAYLGLSHYQAGERYALVKEMRFPAFAVAADTAFYEVSTESYTYRVEAEILSVETIDAISVGSFAEIRFSYRVYEDGYLKPEIHPVLAVAGVPVPSQRLSNYTYAAVVGRNNEVTLVTIEDPISGIIIKGKLLL